MVMLSTSKKNLLLILLTAVFFLGCGEAKDPTGTIAGRVTYKSEAFINGYLGIHNPETGLNRTSQLDEAGNYQFANVPPGEYIVLVVPRALDDEAAVRKIPIPEKLKRKDTSDLSVTVEADQESKLDIELSK